MNLPFLVYPLYYKYSQDILRFSVDNGVTRILADIPGKNNMGGQAFTELICTAAIKRRRNPPKNRRIENGSAE